MKRSVGFVVVLLLGTSHLSSADPAIKPGIDVFATVGGGFTYYDFAKNPIPAGFFCDSFTTFTDRVALKGLPVETGVPGQLRNTDTIVERLDPAVFDANGVAETRIQFRALSMVSIAPIKTSCGAFHVYITLDGQQPITKMLIYRSEAGGGSFSAPLAANVRLRFVPVRGTISRKLELKGSVRFPGKPIPWTFPNGKALNQMGSAVVDTDGDLRPDTRLPGTSNFMAGVPPEGRRSIHAKEFDCYCTCHDDGGEQHCTMVSSDGGHCLPDYNCF
ncbi:MAG TPA: hypothetical protein VF173_13630 [Thermoanaerobaculia bacterium]|nr:hypothetical protein [Thermoanaerobaculia bacterium]